MRFAFSADIHLSRYSQDKIEDETNLPERLHSIKKALVELAEYCLKHDIVKVFLGGDLLHGKSIIYAIAQEIMLEYFRTYNTLEFYVIDGNHDLSGKGSDVVSALRPLENVQNVHWVRFDEICKFEQDDILLIPYSYNMLDTIKNNKSKILISHFGLSEATLNSGMSIISDISIRDLAGRYDLVLLGHYHKPQEIIRDNISIYYVGSPIQLDWGEKGDEKRFLIVDSDTMDIQSIPFTQYKKHIEIEVTSNNLTEALKAAKAAKNAGDHVKVIMREKVDLTSVQGEFNVVDKTEQDITNRGITSSMSEVDKFKRYLEIKEIPEDDHQKYLNVITAIIEEGAEV
jgi:DNA repair exonuclease SbcCD nuclease subunit